MSDYEVILNLWYFQTPTGAIYELAGRAYVATGTDEEKTNLLKQLSFTDYHIAQKGPVPENFRIILGNGEEVQGLSHVSVLNSTGFKLFEDIINAIEKDLPDNIFTGIAGKTFRYRLSIPNDPLYVMTAILNDGNGRLVPVK